MTKIKICGITRPDDAIAAAMFGADFLGFVFYNQSPRRIEIARAREIIVDIKRKYPRVKPVGVFVEPSLSELRDTIAQTGIALVQLHGKCADSLIAQARQAMKTEVIMAVQIKDDIAADKIETRSADYVLLDAFHKTRYGGTGHAIPAETLIKATKAFEGARIFIAGGIGEDNVEVALALKPYGVDINSKAESRPGVKDHAILQRIITRLRKGTQ